MLLIQRGLPTSRIEFFLPQLLGSSCFFGCQLDSSIALAIPAASPPQAVFYGEGLFVPDCT